MDKKDYEEPRCPMDNSMWVEKKVTPIPVDRIIEKEDAYLAENDYRAAERHLLYWWAEAENGNDERGKLVLLSELMGLYRKLGRGDEAKDCAEKAMDLAVRLELADTVSGATAFLNSGTVYKAFGDPERSLQCFEKAREIYEKALAEEDERKAGLYNNMALTLSDLGQYGKARKLFEEALKIVRKKNRSSEAITLLNIADIAVRERGIEGSFEEVEECLQKAERLLEKVPEEERNGQYAFVCEKCAPVFEHYGYFVTGEVLSDRAKAIYAAQKNGGKNNARD